MVPVHKVNKVQSEIEDLTVWSVHKDQWDQRDTKAQWDHQENKVQSDP